MRAPTRKSVSLAFAAALLLLIAVGVGWVVFSSLGPAAVGPPAKPAGPIEVDASPTKHIDAHYVGATSCAECHAEEMKKWTGSHHDRAIEVPTDESVEGDFSGVTFTKEGVTSRFFKKDGDFYVRTEGEDGNLHDYQVQYTFGVYPLQQYLVKFPGGRLQALPLCWDNRPKEQGGQRWFHLYPEQRIGPNDPLFWTRPMQNWNKQCAECHSTNLKKSYNPKEDTYHTTFSQIDVSCEACHGPGSRHVQWARAEQSGWYGGFSGGDEQQKTAKGRNSETGVNDLTKAAADSSAAKSSNGDDQQFTDMGLTVKLKPDEPAAWLRDPKTNMPKRSTPLHDRVLMQVCSRCHARRGVTSEKFIPGDDWLQTHQPTLLEQPQYHADGRIRGEVYVWGSFRQSRMYHNGVRCVDCHDPHSLELHLPKEQLCLKCHNAATYDTPEHHFHEPGRPGSECVQCHMPQETYMVVDPRRDHSFRIPRPDRTLALGTPNTCNDCHTEKTAKWAAKHYRQWWGARKQKDKAFASALDAAWEGHPAAAAKLNEAARNPNNTPIARATALGRLQNYASPQSLQTIQGLIESDETLLRMAAVRALQGYPDRRKWSVGATALDDPSRLVRMEAARSLAGAPQTLPGPLRSKAYQQALADLQVSFRRNADRASTVVNKGNLQLSLGNQNKAIEAYQSAIERNPYFTSAYANLADIYRRQNNEKKVQQVLRQGLARVPDAAALHYAMALSQVRQQQHDRAIDSLKKARKYGEANAQYPYLLALAYNSTGRPAQAIAVLESALKKHPQNAQLLQTMATIARDNGRYQQALTAARKLVELAPNNRRYQMLLQQIQRQAQ